jgi:dihydrofolate reductase
MARTQFFTAMSLDGFLADENGSLDWLYSSPHDGEARWNNFFSNVGALAMGASTYRWALSNYPLLEQPQIWREWYEDRPCWVFTHAELPAIPDAPLRFVRGAIGPVQREMSAVAGERNIWIVGGGDLVAQFHEAGFLDDLLVSIVPVTLGAGVPLIPRRIEGMHVESVVQNGQRVEVHYTLDHPSTEVETPN